jgi:hypothetical protein
MRALFVLALIAVGAGLLVATPTNAMPTCSPVLILIHEGPDAAAACIQRNANPCHYAYPHPCE